MHAHSRTDTLIHQFDQALRTLLPGGPGQQSTRPSPASGQHEGQFSNGERRHVAGLMRVNHCGEVCAQALYQGQALTARLPEVREQMDEAAREEVDHLGWCNQRLRELDSRPSVFNPLFYGLSWGLGAAAGLAGDRWSLGFVAETEDQVCQHLDEHLRKLPADDARSSAILQQMRIDESRHAEHARNAGAAPLPFPLRLAMKGMSQVMKFTTYRL